MQSISTTQSEIFSRMKNDTGNHIPLSYGQKVLLAEAIQTKLNRREQLMKQLETLESELDQLYEIIESNRNINH